MLKKALISSVLISSFAVSQVIAAPCNPNATPEAKALLQYLVDISGKKVLCGQESMYSDGAFPSTRDKYVFQKTGKYPAIYTSDFGDVNTQNLPDRAKVVTNAISYHEKGSIIALQYHMIQPDLADGAGFAAMNIKGSTYTKIDDILTEGSTLNTEFKKRLDEIAAYFNTLEKKGIAVMWRPFHEMNGDWFWWSYQTRFKDLWIYEWNYLTNTKKCNNLLWVFGVNYYSNSTATSKESAGYYYPGDRYVDILGCDVYTEYGHSYSKMNHDDLVNIGGGKPIGFSENGTMPDIASIRTTQPQWAFWCTWWGFEGSGKGNTDALYTKNYSDASVITQDEVSIPATGVIQSAVNAAAHNGFVLSHVNDGISFTIDEKYDRTALYSMDGKKIMTVNGNKGFISTRQLQSGTYILSASGNGKVLNTKLTLGNTSNTLP